MKKPAIFLDRDNTLIISDGYLGDPAQVKLIPGAATAVARGRAMGFAIVVVSNQSGVGRGLFGEDAVYAVNRRMDELLRAENPGAVIDRHEFCPFHPEARVERYRQESELRKPRPGMILRAAAALDLDLAASWVIGDAARDIESGHAAGCRTILVSDPSLTASPAAMQPSRVDPDEAVTSLAEAMDIIQAAGGASPPDDPRAVLPAAQAVLPPPPIEPIRKPLVDFSRLESLAQQILDAVRRPPEKKEKFSFSSLLAGLVQALSLAVALLSLKNGAFIWCALYLQLFTIALLLMSRGARE